MISYNPINEKSFPTWHMGARAIDKNGIQFKTDISTDDRKIFNSILTGKEESGQKVLNVLKRFF